MSLAKDFRHDFERGDFKIFDEIEREIYFEDSEGFWSRSIFEDNSNKVHFEDSMGFEYTYQL